MILSDIPLEKIQNRLTHEGLKIKIGRFNTLIKTPKIPLLIKDFYHLYQDCLIIEENDYIDFPISLELTPGIRSFIKPQINFNFCGIKPFEPLPLVQAMPLLEWGMNWCVSQHFHQCLIIHSLPFFSMTAA